MGWDNYRYQDEMQGGWDEQYALSARQEEELLDELAMLDSQRESVNMQFEQGLISAEECDAALDEIGDKRRRINNTLGR